MGLVSSEETLKGLLSLPHEYTVRSSRLPAGRGMLPGCMRRRGRRSFGWQEGRTVTRRHTHRVGRESV